MLTRQVEFWYGTTNRALTLLPSGTVVDLRLSLKLRATMKFFTNASRKSRSVQISELIERSKAYLQYLQSIKGSLPDSAFQFATADWHYDHNDHRCPHDSWVESLTIKEPANDERSQHRSLSISACLLGAFHDGHLLLEYAEVHTYSLESLKARAGHGDWLVDEIRLSENGLVLHEVQFSNNSRWLIEARDISYEWQPSA